ncbi:MAG: GNAT family N-acetyltransferase [Acidobacteria bacterium]|nr:GNAT family N-acetyltransferase [Acidobacteriota bacterium]
MKVEPVILENEFVRLEPLRAGHHEALCRVGLEPELWRLIPTRVGSPAEMREYIETALDEERRGVALPFATVEKGSDRAVGSTRFGNIDVRNRRAEIGWTWIASEFQRTRVNTAAKLLMLAHAFETWKCIRVELKTDALNERSRQAILRLGARQEGIFRQHVICDTGRLRDTVYFSILDNEWPAVKENLLRKLGEI